MEMRRIVFIEVHRYHDAEESTNFGHAAVVLSASRGANEWRFIPRSGSV
jgi:hypothetical protein